MRNYDAIQIIKTSIFKIVRKLDQLIPQSNLLLNSKNRGPWINLQTLGLAKPRYILLSQTLILQTYPKLRVYFYLYTRKL